MTFGEVEALHDVIKLARDVVMAHARSSQGAEAVAWVVIAADEYGRTMDGMLSEHWLPGYLAGLLEVMKPRLAEVLADGAGSARLERLMNYVGPPRRYNGDTFHKIATPIGDEAGLGFVPFLFLI
jgi:hypothetical protein